MKSLVDRYVVAVIPARGESKRVPRKNLHPLAGKPLIVHSIEQARAASTVKTVYVSTDNTEIARVSREAGAVVIDRPRSLATDEAPSESSLLHALEVICKLEAREPDLLVFLQCTSPIREPDDIDNAVRTLVEQNADSVFSACKNRSLLWRQIEGQWQPVNYDPQHRAREQDLPEEYRENGSIYVLKPWVLKNFNNRLGGRIGMYTMDYWCSFQIDEPEDFWLCEWILQNGPVTRCVAQKVPA